MENLSASEKRDLAQMSFPRNFEEPVDMEKVNWEVMRNWMINKLDHYLPDDDIVAEFALELFQVQNPNIKLIQLQLKGFLEDDAGSFCSQVWDLLLSAQIDSHGIPEQLLEEKKQQIVREREKRLDQERREAARRRDINDPRSRMQNSERSGYRGVKKEEQKQETIQNYGRIKSEERHEGHDTYRPNYSEQDRKKYRTRDRRRSLSRDRGNHFRDNRDDKKSDFSDDRDDLGRDRSRRDYYRRSRGHDETRNRTRSRSQSPSRSSLRWSNEGSVKREPNSPS
ncbi:PWI domain-containing protein [Nadsonia fulvescens var. elongata DSM 6958]|uniref:U1 small nuclear ribonucleoprotein component SNU71 n=1 Tax=Nadsonia fulvescens var. elongata DSM 6958 TaxID=857566 RepID=A0A1E3PLC9_9ASCO|nr:PWI domain-containing protein [Nadsonia fulvescens var. elongata DSM 6958]